MLSRALRAVTFSLSTLALLTATTTNSVASPQDSEREVTSSAEFTAADASPQEEWSWFKFRSKSDLNETVEVRGEGRNSGDVTDTWGWNGGQHQQWAVIRADEQPEGIYKLVNRNSRMVADVRGGGRNGDVIQYWYNGGANQHWKATWDGRDFILQNVGTGQFLTAFGHGNTLRVANGYDHETPNSRQRWNVSKVN